MWGGDACVAPEASSEEKRTGKTRREAESSRRGGDACVAHGGRGPPHLERDDPEGESD